MVYKRLKSVRKLTESARLTANFRQALLVANVSLQRTKFNGIQASQKGLKNLLHFNAKKLNGRGKNALFVEQNDVAFAMIETLRIGLAFQPATL